MYSEIIKEKKNHILDNNLDQDATTDRFIESYFERARRMPHSSMAGCCNVIYCWTSRGGALVYRDWTRLQFSHGQLLRSQADAAASGLFAALTVQLERECVASRPIVT